MMMSDDLRMARTEIPKTRFEKIRWLETYLVSTRIHLLADELAKNPATSIKTLKVEDLFGKKAANIADFGLSTLTDKEIAKLLKHPKTLPHLQIWLLMNGGKYWEQRFAEARFGKESAEIQRKRIDKAKKTRTKFSDRFNGSIARSLFAFVLFVAFAFAGWYLFFRPTIQQAVFFEQLVQVQDQGDTEIRDAFYKCFVSWTKEMQQFDSVKRLQSHMRKLIYQLRIVRQHGCLDNLSAKNKTRIDNALNQFEIEIKDLAGRKTGMNNEKKYLIMRQDAERICGNLLKKIKPQEATGD